MNYRHAFHAGNFADVVKHATLIDILTDLQAAAPAVTVIDTHAGAGLYDLAGEGARRSAESQAGVKRLMADAGAPDAVQPLMAAVRDVNAPGETRYYPGSPLIAARRLRPADRLIACEARADDHSILVRSLGRDRRVSALHGDGWRLAPGRTPPAPSSVLVLVDPPYERDEDDEQVLRLTGRILSINPGAVVAIWVPIKDLTSYDAILGGVEDVAAGRKVIAAEARLRPLSDPMRLNGCAMIIVNPPPRLAERLQVIVDYVATASDDPGGRGKIVLAGLPAQRNRN